MSTAIIIQIKTASFGRVQCTYKLVVPIYEERNKLAELREAPIQKKGKKGDIVPFRRPPPFLGKKGTFVVCVV